MNRTLAVAGSCSIILLVISIGVVVYVTQNVNYRETGSPVALTITIIAGVTALMSALVFSSFILNCLGLSDREEALGLPTGSVRAIIALSLIVIFAIMSIFMFQYMNMPVTTQTITIVTNSTIGNQAISNSTTQTIAGSSQAMVDFSKQILTTMGTLVVAIAAFYFGTRAVQVAQGGKEKAELFIDPSGEKTWVVGSDPITIFVKATPEDADVSYDVNGDDYDTVQRDNDSKNRYIYKPSPLTPPTDSKEVTLTFKMPAYSSVSAKELKVTVKKK
jgi:hypothetical protein